MKRPTLFRNAFPILALAVLARCQSNGGDDSPAAALLLLAGGAGAGSVGTTTPSGGGGAGTTPLPISQINFSPLPGFYAMGQTVTLSSATPGVSIYYTIDGSTPTKASTLYTAPFLTFDSVTGLTIKAFAVKTGALDSPVAGAYYINGTGGTPYYAVGGWVSGLNPGNTIVIRNNGGDNLTLSGNGPFTFTTPLLNAAAYNVTVFTQPSGQTCRVDTNNTGTSSGTMAAANFLSVSVVCSQAGYARVTDTGQTSCWNAAGTLLGSCAGTGQDGAFSGTPSAVRTFTGPTQNSTYTSDYTTTDNLTGLVWKTCSEGRSGAACATGTASGADWIGAGLACRNLNNANSGNGYAGLRSWRLPTFAELETLVDYQANTPAGNTTAFPATQTALFNDYYFAANTDLFSATSARQIAFMNGGENLARAKNTTGFVRCVAGTPNPVSSSFTNNNNDTVTDNRTGLTWQRCAMGKNNDSTCTGTASTPNWSGALAYCNALTLAGKTWRLPNIREVLSFFDPPGSATPSTAVFPAPMSTIWSSTTSAYAPGEAWSYQQVTNSQNKGNPMYVYCVTGP